MSTILDFSEWPRVGITHSEENVILDPQEPESSERKTLTNIKGYTKILPDYIAVLVRRKVILTHAQMEAIGSVLEHDFLTHDAP